MLWCHQHVYEDDDYAWFFGRISPSEWAEPDTDDHILTFSHSLWYLMGSLTLQGKPEHMSSLAWHIGWSIDDE